MNTRGPIFKSGRIIGRRLEPMRRLLLLSLAAAVPWACQAHAPAAAARRPADTEPVGRRGANRTVLPVNQVVTPLGVQVELPGLRPQALALSPDGRILITAGKTAELVVVDPATGAIRQRVPLPEDEGRAPARRRRTSSGPTRRARSATPACGSPRTAGARS